MYSQQVLDHFLHPRNTEDLDHADGKGQAGMAECGSVLSMQICVENDILEKVRFKAYGCGATIAAGSCLSEMVQGMSIEDAARISTKALADALGGLPPEKMHCALLAGDALRNAIQDYRRK